MKNSKFIKISSVNAINNKLEVKFVFSKKMSKYFTNDSFSVIYDKNIENVDESILSIPAVLAVIPIAWATGSDLYVEKLDETCLLYLKKIRKLFKETYPQFSSSGNIHIQKIIPNKFDNKRIALFFSGGLDSIDSYKRNKDQNLILITILHVDRFNNLGVIGNDKKIVTKKFSEQEGTEIHYIQSSLWGHSEHDFINTNLLTDEFKIVWWTYVAYSFIQWGLVAPLAVGNIGKVLYGSTYPKNYQSNYSQHFLHEYSYSWANIDVLYDGNLSRQEKIRFLKNTPHLLKNLLVCDTPIRSKNSKNCGFCVKCWRTITGLILEGIDPNECNFHIKNNILDEIKDILNNCQFLFEYRYYFPDIQRHMPNTIEDNEINQRYCSKQFFEWFKNYKFPEYKKGILFLSNFKLFYFSIKYNGICFTVGQTLEYFRRRFFRLKF